jgi:hypothetical protein
MIAKITGATVNQALDGLFAQLASRAAQYVSRTQLHFQNLRERTGNLTKAVEGRSERVEEKPALRVGVFEGPALIYAGVQEYGTTKYNPESPYPTIRPVKGKALAIPVGHALDAMGVPVVPGGPRAWPDPLNFVPFASKSGLIGGLYDENLMPKGSPKFAPHAISGQDPRLVYLLVAKADIKPHWYLRLGVQGFLPQVIKAMQELLESLLAEEDSAGGA